MALWKSVALESRTERSVFLRKFPSDITKCSTLDCFKDFYPKPSLNSFFHLMFFSFFCFFNEGTSGYRLVHWSLCSFDKSNNSITDSMNSVQYLQDTFCCAAASLSMFTLMKEKKIFVCTSNCWCSVVVCFSHRWRTVCVTSWESFMYVDKVVIWMWYVYDFSSISLCLCIWQIALPPVHTFLKFIVVCTLYLS